MHASFLAFSGLLENNTPTTEICVFGPWAAMMWLAFSGGMALQFAVHVTALATLWPHPVSYACSLCALFTFAQQSLSTVALASAILLIYAQHCPCGAPSETQVIAIAWTEAVEAAYFIVTKALALA